MLTAHEPLLQRLKNLLLVSAVFIDQAEPAPDTDARPLLDIVVTAYGGRYEDIESAIVKYGVPGTVYRIQHHRYETVCPRQAA